MARIRTIKPEFWSDEKTGMLPPLEKCLFLGLLNLADDYGVLEFRPKEWLIKIFPYHYHTTTGVVWEECITNLVAVNLIEFFRLSDTENQNEKIFVFIPNFSKHQVINKMSKPIIEGWEKKENPRSYFKKIGLDFIALDPLKLLHHYHTTTTPLLPGRERKGKEKKKIYIKKDFCDFCLTDELLQWGKDQPEHWTKSEMEKHHTHFSTICEEYEAKGKPFGNLETAFKRCVSANYANIRRTKSSAEDSDSSQAWQKVMSISSQASIKGPKIDDILLQSAVKAIGGWSVIGSSTAYEQAALKAKFLDAYNKLADKSTKKTQE